MSAELEEVEGPEWEVGGSNAGTWIVVGTEVDGITMGAEGALVNGTAVAPAEPGFLCVFEQQNPS